MVEDKPKIPVDQIQFPRASDLTWRPCSLGSEIQRRFYLEGLKETYSREYLIKNKFCTAEEYDSTKVTTHQADERKRQAGIADLMHRTVGAENDAWS